MTTPFPLILYPDERLRQSAVPAVRFDGETAKFVKKMIATMRHAHGVGLAAPQIGATMHVFVAELRDGPAAFFNPTITETSNDTDSMEEGCLSIPGIFGIVTRPAWVEISFQTSSGQRTTKRLEGLPARIVQHEMDHLRGVLFIDKWTRITQGEKEAHRLQITLPK